MSRYVAFFLPFFRDVLLFYIYKCSFTARSQASVDSSLGPLAVVPYEGRAEPEASEPREPEKPSAFTEPPLKKPKQASSVSAARPVDLPSMPSIFNRILGGKGQAAKIQQHKTPKTETKPVEPPSKNTKKTSELLLLESMKFVPKQVAEVTGKKTTGKNKGEEGHEVHEKGSHEGYEEGSHDPEGHESPHARRHGSPHEGYESPHEGDDNTEGSGGFEEP